MKASSISLNICLAVSTGCLGAGYILGGYWPVMPVLLVIGIFWLLVKKQLVFRSASTLLLLYLLLAVIGVMVGLSLPLMVIGCATALACWDLTQFEQSMRYNPPLETNIPLERHRLQSLAMAVIIGLTLAMVSSYINLEFPLVVIMFLVLTAMGCLTYGYQYIKSR